MNSYSLKRRTHRCKQETNLTGYRCRLRWKYRILVKMIFVQIMLSVIFLAITSFCSRMLSICRGLLPSMNFKVYWKVNQKNQTKIIFFPVLSQKHYKHCSNCCDVVSVAREEEEACSWGHRNGRLRWCQQALCYGHNGAESMIMMTLVVLVSFFSTNLLFSKNLRGDILKHRTRMKDEALEEGDYLVRIKAASPFHRNSF